MLTPIALLIAAGCSMPVLADSYFNPRFLSDDPAAVADLSAFEKGLEAPPGTYWTELYINDRYTTSRNVTFSAGKSGLEPCLTRGQLGEMGVRTAVVPGMAALAPTACVPLKSLMPDASTRFDVGRQRLYVSIPQTFMNTRAQGYVPPELWDNGINAGLLNYSFSGNTARTVQGGENNYAYLNLMDGFNLGAWRFRDNTIWTYSSGGNSPAQNKWTHVNTYAERDIIPWRARLTLGDGYTPADVFDGVNFRGAQIASDDNMLADSLRGFAPVIHGIARGTAQVSVKQNGYEIYQTTVPSGPFTINDLYAAGNSGDLQVTVREADGSVQVFSVPYSSVPVLQREGNAKYAMTVGQFRSGNGLQDTPTFVQGTLMWGLSRGWTVYGGTQMSDNYQAFNGGVGKDLGRIGAVSADITQASATLPDGSDKQGQSLRFMYSKSLNEWGTNFQLVGYRYSTQGYFTLSDTAYNRMSGYRVVTDNGVMQEQPKFTDYYNLSYNRRGQVQISLSQQVGRTATVYLSGSQQTYWQTDKTDQQVQAGYSGNVRGVNYSLGYSISKYAWQPGRDQSISLSLNVPFSIFMRSDSTSAFRNSSASYNMTNDQSGRTTNQAGIYGTLLKDQNLSYNVQSGYTSGGTTSQSATGSAALNYQGAYGNANVGYSRSSGFDQLYYGFSGGVLAHADGVTLSQPLTGTAVLIKAPGAGNVAVENMTGVKTDWRGYAVLPYATNYRENRVALNTNSLPDNVDLDDPVVTVVPTHDAVVRASFTAHVGMKVLMTVMHDGKPLPFGATVSSADGTSGSIVADNGQVYLTGLPPEGTLLAKWGDAAAQQCHIAYRLPEAALKQVLSYATGVCR
ncbi:fimbrial biogenesis usher protein [Pantoea ananatis]|uniref:fimbrial biogenesis usher protein n=1 Tax=Pantoea ananas TaxID=553 RepID=UPI0024ACD336|nr:fimbrial biogenesis usher protein [Pantoea ananatis]MDI6539110.1 fimbrial biogenesis usher protein [Pantoea ananatis]